MNDQTREFLRQRVDSEKSRELTERFFADLPDDDQFRWDPVSPAACPRGPHRGPQGPNEDLSQCGTCWSPSHAMRPDGEEFGGHLADCSLPRRHESYCEPGGSGHPPPAVVRGYWPSDMPANDEEPRP